MADEWVPFGLDAEAQVAYRVLVPGVPEWLREPLIAWLSERWAGGSDTRWLRRDRLLELQTAVDVDMGILASSSSIVDGDMIRLQLRATTEFELLRIVDYMLASQFYAARNAHSLEKLLLRARSAYTVGTRMGKVGLVDRVPEGVRVAAEEVAATAPDAGPLLARAWSHAHGLEPNDTAAYADAVRAVEAVAIPAVTPGNAEATLGSVIAQMRQHGDWRLPLREHDHAPSAEMLVQMLRTLWRGHRDRHGHLDYSDVTHEEAETAVALAVTLVSWFASGAVQRRPVDNETAPPTGA